MNEQPKKTLKQIREELDLTQREASEILGVYPSNFCRMEKDLSRCKLTFLKKNMKALGFETKIFLCKDGENFELDIG